jgi:type IV pilus assembly protein PilF
MITKGSRPSLAWLITMTLACGGVAVAAVNVEASRANLQLGVSYLQQGNLPIAKQKLERARDQNPRDMQVHSALALLYEKLGEDALADSEHKIALRLAPRDPDVQNNYAVYLCRKGRTAEGVALFEKSAADRLYRTPWAAYTNAGVCLRRAGRDAEAAQRFQKAVDIRADYGEAVLQLADLELAQKDAVGSYRRVEAYLARYPANADLLLLAWRAARALQDQANVERLAKRLQAEYPRSEQARAVAAAVPGKPAG